MTYYLIFLKNGRVVQINSWDEMEGRDRQFEAHRAYIRQGNSAGYDDVQFLDEVQ